MEALERPRLGVVVATGGSTPSSTPSAPRRTGAGHGAAGSNALSLPTRTATFSSTEYGETIGLADQKVGGYPGVRAEEWSTNKEGTGAWATLAWSTPQTVSKVVLFDRINTADQIMSSELAFDDGSIVPVGAVPNEPTQGPLVVSFPARKARSMTFLVKSVSSTTENVGLSELAVY